MIFAATRTARKVHQCGRCYHEIRPGDRYRVAALTPNSDLGNVGWWHEKECAPCAEMCGRPIPAASSPKRCCCDDGPDWDCYACVSGSHTSCPEREVPR